MNVPLLLIGTGSGFAHSLYSVVSKYAIKERVRTPFLFLLYINVFQACISPVLWLGAAPTCPSAEVVPPLLIAGLTCALAYGFLYSSLSRGDVSSVMPIMGSKVIFSAFLARLMLLEGHSWPIYMAILLVAVSIATLSYSPTEGQTSRFRMKPIVLMLVCCFLFSITDVFIKKSLLHIDTYNFLIYYNIIYRSHFCFATNALHSDTNCFYFVRTLFFCSTNRQFCFCVAYFKCFCQNHRTHAKSCNGKVFISSF